MKKIKYFLFIFLLSIVFIPKVYAKANVEITNVELEELNGVAEELKTPDYENMNLKLNIRFNEVDDSIKYKVTIKNDDEQEYKINLKSDDKSNNVIYEYIVGEKLAPKTETIAYVTAKYNKPVTNFINGKHSENNSAVIKLLTVEPIENPETGIYSYIGIIAIILVITFIVGKNVSKKNKFKYMSILVLLVASPLVVKAAEETIKLSVVTNVEISQTNQMCIYNTYKYITDFIDSNQKMYYLTYTNGQRIEDFLTEYLEQYSEDDDIEDKELLSLLESLDIMKTSAYYFIKTNDEILNGVNQNEKGIYDIDVHEYVFDVILRKHNFTFDDYEKLSDEEHNQFWNEIDEYKNEKYEYTWSYENPNNKIHPSSKGCYLPLQLPN